MDICGFQDLCDGFCAIAGVQAPQLAADADGLVAFHAQVRGITINVLQRHTGGSGYAFVLVECGEIPEHDAHRVMQSLLDANFAPLQPDAPTFARNPATGDAVLQYVFRTDTGSPAALFDLVCRGVDAAERWQHGHFAAPESGGPNPAPGALA